MPAEADRERGEGPDHEEHRTSDAGGRVVGRKCQQDQRDDHHEDGERLGLAAQERFRAFLDGECDLSHARGPGISCEDLAHECVCDSERQNGDHTDHCDETLFASGQ